MHNFVDYISVIVHIGMYFLLAVTKRRQFPRLGESSDRFRPDWLVPLRWKSGHHFDCDLKFMKVDKSGRDQRLGLFAYRCVVWFTSKKGDTKLNPRKSLSCSVLFILWPLVETKYSIKEMKLRIPGLMVVWFLRRIGLSHLSNKISVKR